MPVKDVVAKLKCNILVCTVERGDDAFIANGNFIFEGNDVVSIIASRKNAADFFKKIGFKHHSIKDIIVIGAGNITEYLCELLADSGISVKIIDNDFEKCANISSLHRKSIVINGDRTDRELLIEEGIENTDAFVILSENDEENILLSLFAKAASHGKVIMKVNRSEYDDIIKHLGIDTSVYPKNITSDMIVRYVRAMKNTLGSNVETMYSVIKDKVEASEFIVGESVITGVPLSSLKLKRDVLIAAILRGGNVIIPRGQDTIEKGDAVVIVSKILGLHDISEVMI
jgi:trk system potassium uptake protein TrkA